MNLIDKINEQRLLSSDTKKLLLTDLSGRLAYGVKCQVHTKAILGSPALKLQSIYDTGRCYFGYGIGGDLFGYKEVMPLLRHMKSMTQEEVDEFYALPFCDFDCYMRTEWLNEHHFDYRGLIEKGFAIEANEDTYK